MDIFSVAQGKPRPVVTWYKDGQPIDPKMVNIHNSNVDSILFIRSAEREHSGKYELVLQIENMEDRATIEIRVIGKVLTGDICLYSNCNVASLSTAVTENYWFNKTLSEILTFILFRKAWTSSECESDRRLGLQRSTGVGSPQGWWQLWDHWIQHSEGRHED